MEEKYMAEIDEEKRNAARNLSAKYYRWVYSSSYYVRSCNPADVLAMQVADRKGSLF